MQILDIRYQIKGLNLGGKMSIVHKCQTLIKGIFNNIEVNCICGIVSQVIFHRVGAKLTHLADCQLVTTSNVGF